MAIHNVVLLTQRDRLTCSLEKETQIEMHTAYHLRILNRGFQNGIFHENLMENLDETHFTVNMDNGKALGFWNDTSVKYADVVGREAMTMVVRISGGRGSNLEAPMIIFTNGNSNYPIRGIEDSILRVSYCISPKGCMDQSIFFQYFIESRTYQPDHHGHTKYIWVDNCTTNNMTPILVAALAQKRTILKYLSICATHLC